MHTFYSAMRSKLCIPCCMVTVNSTCPSVRLILYHNDQTITTTSRADPISGFFPGLKSKLQIIYFYFSPGLSFKHSFYQFHYALQQYNCFPQSIELSVTFLFKHWYQHSRQGSSLQSLSDYTCHLLFKYYIIILMRYHSTPCNSNVPCVSGSTVMCSCNSCKLSCVL